MTIDDDLASQLTELAHASRTSFKNTLNDTLRSSLTGKLPPEKPFRLRAHDGGLRPGIDDRRLNELVFELEEQRFAAKTGGPKD